MIYMGLFQVFKSLVFVAVVVAGEFHAAKSTLYIYFDQTPPAQSRLSRAVFRYSVLKPDGSSACRTNTCSFHCELDGRTFRACPPHFIEIKNLTVNKEHTFLLNVTSRNGETNSSAYSWFIDTIQPTATISSQQNYTNAEKITVDITFSEACSGFKCLNSSNCDVIVRGPSYINYPSLRIIKRNIRYTVDLILTSKVLYGHVVIGMKDNLCTDMAGNYFKRTNTSVVVIHVDRRPVLVDLWTSVPSYVVCINGVPRTLSATNNVNDVKIFLDFNVPIQNSTEQIISVVDVSSGSLVPTSDRSLGNRHFVLQLKNVLNSEIITVKMQASLIIGRTGIPMSPVNSFSFLYDYSNPAVRLSTSAQTITKESDIDIIVEFTKPVFGFKSSAVEVVGGRLIRFLEHSRALYSLTITAVTQPMVSVAIPAGKVKDISGNPNLASNKLQVKHYMKPGSSVTLHTFITAAVVATSLAAALLSVASANLEATGIASVDDDVSASDLSTNLFEMVGHLQLFVLSDWLLANPPVEYSETIQGLKWLIPRQKLPWKRKSADHLYFMKDKPSIGFSSLAMDVHFKSNMQHNLSSPLHLQPDFGEQNNISMTSFYGLPLSAAEYFTYFLRGEPISANNVIKKMENYKGWKDLEMNLFWLGIGAGSLLVTYSLFRVFLRWRTQRPTPQILLFPRFELLLLLLVLPCISQSSAFVIRGGTTWGIITGALLLAVPAAVILSLCIFLLIVVFSSSFTRYKEINNVTADEPWYTKVLTVFVGSPVKGKWFSKDGIPSSFLSRFGILFQNRKGPPSYIVVYQDETNTIPRWSQTGNSDYSNEEMKKVSLSSKVLGCAKSSYIVIDLIRRVGLGFLSGIHASHKQSLTLSVTLIQFLFLICLRPHIRRGVHVAECISLVCEIGLFGVSIVLKSDKLGVLMLVFLFITLVSQLVKQWYSLIKFMLKFSPSEKTSFGYGFMLAAKGIVLPIFPKKYWSRVMAGSGTPETEERRVRPSLALRSDSFRAMSATVVPVLSPGTDVEAKRSEGIQVEATSGMKKLRELAKASFSG